MFEGWNPMGIKHKLVMTHTHTHTQRLTIQHKDLGEKYMTPRLERLELQ